MGLLRTLFHSIHFKLLFLILCPNILGRYLKVPYFLAGAAGKEEAWQFCIFRKGEEKGEAARKWGRGHNLFWRVDVILTETMAINNIRQIFSFQNSYWSLYQILRNCSVFDTLARINIENLHSACSILKRFSPYFCWCQQNVTFNFGLIPNRKSKLVVGCNWLLSLREKKLCVDGRFLIYAKYRLTNTWMKVTFTDSTDCSKWVDGFKELGLS